VDITFSQGVEIQDNYVCATCWGRVIATPISDSQMLNVHCPREGCTDFNPRSHAGREGGKMRPKSAIELIDIAIKATEKVRNKTAYSTYLEDALRSMKLVRMLEVMKLEELISPHEEPK